MKVELTIDSAKKFPDGALPAFNKELLKRLNDRFENCSLVINRGSKDNLTVITAGKDVKQAVENILQETWESAEDWFC